MTTRTAHTPHIVQSVDFIATLIHRYNLHTELLEALKATLDWMQDEAIPTIKCQQIVKTIDAVIAKAEGR